MNNDSEEEATILRQVFENTDQYKGSVKPFKQQITDEYMQQKEVKIADQIVHLLENKNQYLPQVYLNAVRFLKETVNPNNTIWKKEVENKILPVLFKVALFNKENQSDDRGKQYFLQSQQQCNNAQAFGNSFLRLVLECIEVWGTIYEQSEFQKFFIQLSQHQMVKFPDIFNYFKDFKKNQSQQPIFSSDKQQPQQQHEEQEVSLHKKLKNDIDYLKQVCKDQKAYLQSFFLQNDQKEGLIQKFIDEKQNMVNCRDKIAELLKRINQSDNKDDDCNELELFLSFFEGYLKNLPLLKDGQITQQKFEQQFNSFFLPEESPSNSIKQTQQQKLDNIEQEKEIQLGYSQQNEKYQNDKNIRIQNDNCNKNQDNNCNIKTQNDIIQSQSISSIIKSNQKLTLKNNSNFSKLDPNSSFYSNSNNHYIKNNSNFIDQSKISSQYPAEQFKKADYQTLLREKNNIQQMLENAQREIQKLKIENKNLKDELIHYKSG